MKNHPSKSLVAMVAVILWGTGAIFAQGERSATSESRYLRFVSRRSVEHLQLRVHDKAGALIYDSGLVAKSDLVWLLSDNNGNALKPGLYNWALTINEPGKATALVKRGALNIEHTNEPPSVPPLTPVTGGGGSVATIPKLAKAADIGDSVIVENNGNVAIGATPSGIVNIRAFLQPPDNNADETSQAAPTPPSTDDPVNDASDEQTAGSAAPGVATNSGRRNQQRQENELRQKRQRRAEARGQRRRPHSRRERNRP